MEHSIDREKVIKGLHQHCECSLFDRCGECPYYETDYDSWGESKFKCRDALLQDTLALLKEQETANLYKCPNCGTWVSAENVVRCKDCKHILPKGFCHKHSRKVTDNWFCADGERKE